MLSTRMIRLTRGGVMKIWNGFSNEKDERFFRLIDFDARYLNEVPWVFKPLQPAISLIKETIITTNEFIGLPWWAVLMISSVVIRLGIFPLILIQMKRMSKIGPIWPLLVHIKDGWRHSNFPFFKRLLTSLSIYRAVSKQQNFRLSSIFVYNLAYYPILITMIFSLRKLLGDPVLKQATFLHMSTLVDMDPYYVLPTLTVGLYYWNFQRFITPQNKHTLISKIRGVCQFLLILWYPFLCFWPSGIVIYMCTNAVISVIQSSIMTSRWFMSKTNEKTMHYNIMLHRMEYDKGTSESIMEAIRTGEESLKIKGIKEEVLMKQIENMVSKLKQENKNQDKEEQQKKQSQKKNIPS